LNEWSEYGEKNDREERKAEYKEKELRNKNDRCKTASVTESCPFNEVYLPGYKIFISSAIKYRNNFVVYVPKHRHYSHFVIKYRLLTDTFFQMVRIN
jgi:hypothetical protein